VEAEHDFNNSDSKGYGSKGLKGKTPINSPNEVDLFQVSFNLCFNCYFLVYSNLLSILSQQRART
jgi:hypothetical protein